MNSFFRRIKKRIKYGKEVKKRIKYGKEVNDKIFLRNGKILLKELIASSNGKYNPIRHFSAKELQTATNNYNNRNAIESVLGNYLYKGYLENCPIMVMKVGNPMHTYSESVKNIVFASQMSHKNILKLIGCCLKTEIPITVYESIGYDTLSDHIFCYHDQGRFKALVWRDRLRIAMGVANVVAYLHVGFPRPIIHRSVLPSNILLDEQCVAKLYDFSLSEIIPEGEIDVIICNGLIGTNGFLAPDSVAKGIFNEKSDVYSFGVLLLILFTGKSPITPNPKDENEGGHLKDFVTEYYQKNKLNEIVDPIIVGDEIVPDKNQQLLAFAELALKCSSESTEERPTMVDVAKQLREMYKSSINVP